jgi:transcriptional regulator with XRE-family HTH domain
MTGNKSISEYAEQLDIGAISLRQFIGGNTQRPRQKTLDLIGNALELPADEVRRRLGLAPETSPSFGDWLDERMKASGYSRARLTRETNISDGALRNYLANRTLPDSDQAQRIAEVLGASPLEIANVIVAQTVRENGGALADSNSATEAPREPVPAAVGGSGAVEMRPVELSATTSNYAATGGSPDEHALLGLWRQLHPQGRRATFSYIAMLLAER